MMVEGTGNVTEQVRTTTVVGQNGLLTASNASRSIHYSYQSSSNNQNAPGGLKFTDNEDENSEKFETVGQPIDIKMNSSNKNFGHLDIEDVIESKNFILNVNEKLRDTFPVGNFYASKVIYFKDLEQMGKADPGQSQLIISNEKYGDIQRLITENPDVFVIYVSNDMPSVQKGNTLIIK